MNLLASLLTVLVVFVMLFAAEQIVAALSKKSVDHHSRIYNEWWKKGQ